MTTVPFGTDITLAASPSQASPHTPTIVGVIGQVGTGASLAAGTPGLAHNKTEALTLVGSDGELHDWAEQYYAIETGEVLFSVVPAFTANDDADRVAKANAAIAEFEEDIGTEGIRPSLIDIHDYGTNVASGAKTDASAIVSQLETTCEKIRALGFANFPAESTDTTVAWQAELATWAANNRKPRVMACARTMVTAAVADGIAASTLLTAIRAKIDGESGITEPLGNKPVPGVVRGYPSPVPYSISRGVSNAGRTIQNTIGVSTIANYRGWKTVRAELATSTNRRYESILRAVSMAENRFEESIQAHMDGRNGAVEQALLTQQLDVEASAMITENLIREARFQPVEAGTDDNGDFKVTLRGQVITVKPLVQVDLFVEVS